MSVTIQSALEEATRLLAANSVDAPRDESRLLIMHVLGVERPFLIAHPEHPFPSDELKRLRALVARRAAGEPLQYLTGRQQFFKLDFEVTPDVLIPRPETELIVEAALDAAKSQPGVSFADIGTGSGCIAISLLRELPDAHASAVEVSARALLVARRNSERHNVSGRLRLIESDGFSGIDASECFDLIVSNPPYVSDEELQTLQREVRHEPRGALAGGPDGLAVIRRLLQDAPAHLRAGGHFIFEIGFSQAETVKELIDQKTWELIDIKRDLAAIPRTVILRRK